MRELHDVIEALFDEDDGSCRELTFQGSSWDGVAIAVEKLARGSRTEAAHDEEGLEISRPFGDSVAQFSTSTRPVSMYFIFESEACIVKRVRLFVSKDDDGSPYVEITFFPEEVDRSSDVKQRFVGWSDELQVTLRAQRYYARYENASWRVGDVGPTSGVFLVSNDLRDGA